MSRGTDIRRKAKRLAKGVAINLAIIVATLAFADLVLIAIGAFPPTTTPGHPELGWVSWWPTGEMAEQTCWDFAAERDVHITRNEDGYRTAYPSARLKRDSTLFRIAATGDSHTDLCMPNESTHFGVMERELTERGLPSAAFSYAAGKYSPLQAYLAVKDAIGSYSASALVLNLYTGNDFYDMLRIDDRPHFVPDGDGYAVAPPVWYQEDPPEMRRRSRVLYALRAISDRTGIRRVYVRVRYLADVARAQGQGLGSVVGYMNDLRRSTASEVYYPQAFAAQMLNQQLFFHRFGGSREESVRRVRALLEMIRRENPDLPLILSPIPSYELVYDEPVNESLLRVLDRLPITYESGVSEERALYGLLKEMAAETGWIFIDNLESLSSYEGHELLYNEEDYHILPPAAEIIGEDQADVIMTLSGHRP